MRTLVVDDNPMMAEVLKMNMIYLGYDVDSAEDGIEAIAKLEENHYDVVITDGYMPKMTGYALCQFVRSRFSSTFLIGITGSRNLQGFKDAGADVCFAKPFHFSELQHAIESHYQGQPASPVDGVEKYALADKIAVRTSEAPSIGF